MQAKMLAESATDFVPDAFGPIVPWHGGACPVPSDAVVRLHFRGRAPYVGFAICRELPDKFKASVWQHAPYLGRSDPAMDVIGYQVLNG